MGRRRPNLLARLSLILCVVLAALWIRSYYCWDRLLCPVGANHCYILWSADGQVRFRAHTGPPESLSDRGELWIGHRPTPEVESFEDPMRDVAMLTHRMFWNPGAHRRDAIFSIGGLRIESGVPFAQSTETSRFVELQLAYGWLFIATAILLLLAKLRGFYQRRRVRAGFCVTCNYDLRASKDRCPECGTLIKPATTA